MIEEPIYKKGNPLRGGEPDPNNQQDHTVRAVGAAGGFEGGVFERFVKTPKVVLLTDKTASKVKHDRRRVARFRGI